MQSDAFDLIKLTRLENNQNKVLQVLKIMVLHYIYTFFGKWFRDSIGNSVMFLYFADRQGSMMSISCNTKTI